MLSLVSLSILAFLSFVSASCGRRTSHVRSLELPKFGYDPSTNGPLHWHSLDTAFFVCADGVNQAPTNVLSASTHTISGSELKLDIPMQHDVEFENLGTTVEVAATGTLEAEGKKYTLKQFHFHIPSEHRIDDKTFAQEVHFVFQTENNETAVMSLLLETVPLANRPVFDTLAFHVGKIAELGQKVTIPSLDFTDITMGIVSAKAQFFALTQSLTTPPCTEGVRWYIAAQAAQFSVHSWLQFKEVIKFNSRNTQNALGDQNLIQIAAKNLRMQPEWL